MTLLHPWWEEWGSPCDQSAIVLPSARKFMDYVARRADGLATICGARRSEDGVEAVLLDVQTNRPQRPAIPILRQEPVAVLFSPEDRLPPTVLALRPEFPDAPHQNLAPEGAPKPLCIDDRPWAETRATWTSAELLHRIMRWFERAGMGELHDNSQPLDPFFAGAALNVIVPRNVFDNVGQTDLVAHFHGDQSTTIVAVPYNKAAFPGGAAAFFSFLFYPVEPRAIAKMRHFPTSLAGLIRDLKRMGLDLIGDLLARASDWADQSKSDQFRLNSKLSVLVQIPVLKADSEKIERQDIYAFLTTATVGEIGVALGRLFPGVADGQFSRRIHSGEPNNEELEKIKVVPAHAHLDFDRELAATVAGRATPDCRRTVLVGAGAIGSMIAECLVREARFDWTVVDPDTLLPHNLARHTLTRLEQGTSKAPQLVQRLLNVCGGLSAEAIVADVMNPGERAEQLGRKLEEADVIIDASASVPVARSLSDGEGKARRASVFFNPAGTDVVLLVEDADRSIDLRSLEAAYHRAILTAGDLADHLSKSAGQVPYTGACRAVTNRIPASRALALSAIAAGAMGKSLDRDEAFGAVWQLHDDGSIARHELPTEEPAIFICGGWKVMLPTSVEKSMVRMRTANLPAETGGVLLGIIDVAAQRIDLVDAWSAPVGSKGSPTGFERGTGGLKDDVMRAIATSLDQIRYVGEWHSHPRGASTAPSRTDICQIGWLAETMSSDECPRLMLIVGDSRVSALMGTMEPTLAISREKQRAAE
jgi:proteasome lid subunit RPN8/RPN11